jgi:hypothetical protein
VTQDFNGPRELNDRSLSALPTPPALDDRSRTVPSETEHRRRRSVTEGVRPRLVAKSEHICEALLDMSTLSSGRSSRLEMSRATVDLPAPGAPETTIRRFEHVLPAAVATSRSVAAANAERQFCVADVS